MQTIRILLLSLLALPACQASAAEFCMQSRSVADEFAEATQVLAAEAKTVTIEFSGHPTDSTRPREVQLVEWEVIESWKGQYKPKEWFETRTVINDSHMGRSVTQSEAYLLYLIDPSWIGTCTRTSVLKHAVRDIPVLYNLATDKPDGT